MLTRFCKLCYRTFDESIISSRRLVVKYSTVASEHHEDDEDRDQEFVEESFTDTEESVPKSKRKCIIQCKRKSFNYYKGDTYPKFEPIPLASRSWQHRKAVGDYFTIFPDDMEIEIDVSNKFRNIKLNEILIENLENNDIVHPSLIQKLSIPKILNGENVILTAETGCGKTFAFLVPLLEQILKWKPMMDRGCNRPLGLIITPSRELVFQIAKEAKKLSQNLDINIVKLIGGRTKKLMNNPPITEVDLIIASFGVMSKLVTTGVYKMDQLKHLVIDEADILFDGTFNKLPGFLRKIPIGAARCPDETYPTTTQLTLSSATIPEDINEALAGVVSVETLQPITTGHQHKVTVPQKFLRILGSQKPMMLLKLVKPKARNGIPTIIFSNDSAACNYTKLFLEEFNIDCVTLHGKMPREIRRGQFMKFKNGSCSILTTTDAGARGLDTTSVQHIINFDFPLITSEYIHRCGRTGRIGSPKDCRVVNFISKPLEIILTRKIEFAMRKNKPIPMIDMIHSDKDEERKFLSSNLGWNNDATNTKTEAMDDASALYNTKNEISFRIPQ